MLGDFKRESDFDYSCQSCGGPRAKAMRSIPSSPSLLPSTFTLPFITPHASPSLLPPPFNSYPCSKCIHRPLFHTSALPTCLPFTSAHTPSLTFYFDPPLILTLTPPLTPSSNKSNQHRSAVPLQLMCKFSIDSKGQLFLTVL